MSLPRRILAWDAPNMDMCIAQLLGCKPTPAYRPNFVALARWFVQSGDGGADGHAVHDEAAVFVNVPEHLAERLRQWVMWLTASGYRVFAKPKVQASDIDDEMLAYIASVPPGALSEVVLASHDAQAFLAPLTDLARAGVRVKVVGFAELAGGLSKSRDFEFATAYTLSVGATFQLGGSSSVFTSSTSRYAARSAGGMDET